MHTRQADPIPARAPQWIRVRGWMLAGAFVLSTALMLSGTVIRSDAQRMQAVAQVQREFAGPSAAPRFQDELQQELLARTEWQGTALWCLGLFGMSGVGALLGELLRTRFGRPSTARLRRERERRKQPELSAAS